MWKWREQRGYRGKHKGAEWLQRGTQGGGATEGDTRGRGYRGGHKGAEWLQRGTQGGGATEGDTREQRGYRGRHSGYRGGHRGAEGLQRETQVATEGNLSWQPAALVTHTYTHTRGPTVILALLSTKFCQKWAVLSPIQHCQLCVRVHGEVHN